MAGTADIPELDARGLRSFAFTTGGILVALFGVLIPWLLGFKYPLWPWLIAGILAVWGFAAPATLGPVYRTWMRFGLLMSRIMTPLVLGLVYYLVITPIAAVMRARGRDPLARELKAGAGSYRVPAERQPVEKMEKPY